MVEYFNGGEKLMNYTELFKIFNSINEDGSKMGNFDNINDHSKVKYNIWEVKFLWDKVEEKWEPIQTIKKYDKLTLAAYERNNKLLFTPTWKCARQLTKNFKKFIRLSRIFSAQTKWHNIKYKY